MEPTAIIHTGKIRNWILNIVLGIITLGIYVVYWETVSFADLKKFRGRGMGGFGGFILFWFLIPNYFLLPSEIEAAQKHLGIEPTVSALSGFWLLVPVVGGLLWIYKVQEALNLVWETAGVQIAKQEASVLPPA